MRVHERRHRQPRRVVVRRRDLPKEVDDLLCEHAVAHEAGVGLVRTVRFPADPAGEAVGIEAVGAAVRVDRDGVEHAVGVVDPEALVRAGNGQVGVGDVPLAAVVRAVPGCPEPVAHGRDGVGIQEVHGRVGGLLGEAVGVGDAVQRRVLPGEERGATRRAHGRARVVAVELAALAAETLACRQLLAAERGQRLLLVRRRVPLFVGHDEEHVGSRRGHRRAKLPSATHQPTTRIELITSSAAPKRRVMCSATSRTRRRGRRATTCR